MVDRPYPPEPLATPLEVEVGGRFQWAPEVEGWIRSQILAEDGPLCNPEHAHLEMAEIGVLWTNVPAKRKQRVILGQAELVRSSGDPWGTGRRQQQLIEWFGDIPDFLVTLYAPYCAEATDRQFAALVEHELCHCGQALDAFGGPKFNRETGMPIFDLVGHDVEEFTSVVRRYGVVTPEVRELAAAANQDPEIGEAEIAQACGACLKA